MTAQDLEKSRREKWRTAGTPVSTGEDARAFLDSVGIALLYPPRPAVLLPMLLAATIGDDRGLPEAKRAFADPRAVLASELAFRLVAARRAYVSNVFPDNLLLISPPVFPYFYALLGERVPGSAKSGREELSQLAKMAWKVFEQEGRLTRETLRERLSAELSIVAVERALGELWRRLRIMPVERNGEERWESLQRWAPDAVKQGSRIATPVALSALVSQYLEGVVAAEPREIEDVLSHLAPRSKVKEATNAMLSAREFSFVNIGHRSLLQITPERPAYVPRPQKTAIAPRPKRTPPEKRRRA